MSNLRAIKYLIVYLGEKNITNSFGKKALQLSEITISSLLSEFSNMEKNKDDAHYEEFEAIVNVLLSELSEVRKKQVIKGAIDELANIHLALKDPEYKIKSTDLYSYQYAI